MVRHLPKDALARRLFLSHASKRLLLAMTSHLIVRHRRILALALQVVLVLHGLLGGQGLIVAHITSSVWQAALRRHAATRNLSVGVVVRRVNLVVVVNAILIASSRLRRVEARLNQILAFWFRDERLELWCCEGIDQTSLGHDEKKDLRSSKD